MGNADAQAKELRKLQRELARFEKTVARMKARLNTAIRSKSAVKKPRWAGSKR